MKRRAVIVERAAHRRLRLIDALRKDFQIDSIEMLDGCLRLVRTIRPDLVLIGVGRRTQLSARMAYQIKTDGAQPPLVGLLDWDGRLSDPAAVVVDSMVDGILLGSPTSERLEAFLSALADDEPSIIGELPTRGWRKLLGR